MKSLKAILDDRVAIVGTAGSGKTYGAKTLTEELLDSGARVCIVDPLGVWWGLRSNAAGDGPGYAIVVFGGKHADVPIDEGSGAALAQIVAEYDFPSIIDLSELPSQTKRRQFMRDFAETIYAKNSRSLHLIMDEADLWAPQKPIEPAAQILGARIDEIVRRGRVRGFIPWLITQRPAVISKDVLSQLDVLIAMKLVSSQDRNALDAWIEGQADKADQKRIIASLPKMQVGSGIVWAPGHGILIDYEFPKIKTFDSSKTPKRGEKVKGPTKRAEISVEAIQSIMTAAKVEIAANDPAALRKRIAELEKLAGKQDDVDDAALDASYQDGVTAGIAQERARQTGIVREANEHLQSMRRHLNFLDIIYLDEPNGGQTAAKRQPIADVAQPVEHRPSKPSVAGSNPIVRSKSSGGDGLTGPQRQLLAALAWWSVAGHQSVTRPQLAAVAGWKITSGHLKNVAGSLRTLGLISYPAEGSIALTAAGVSAAPMPDAATLHQRIAGILSGPQNLAFNALLKAGKPISREQLCKTVGWEPTSGHVKNVLGSLRTLQLINYPESGMVGIEEWAR